MIIGGGGGDQRTGETRDIDRFALAATGKASPRVLFLPTGTKDSLEYVASAQAAFQALGVTDFRPLLLTRNPSPRAVDEGLDWADLVFLGGGAAPLIAKHGQRYHLGGGLARARDRGAVLLGISGGAIALFEGGVGAYNGYRDLPGWGLAPGYLLPHFHPGEESRLGPWFASHPGRELFGVEDGAAVVWDGGRFGVMGVRPGSQAWSVSWAGTGPEVRLVPPLSSGNPPTR